MKFLACLRNIKVTTFIFFNDWLLVECQVSRIAFVLGAGAVRKGGGIYKIAFTEVLVFNQTKKLCNRISSQFPKKVGKDIFNI